MEFRVLDNEIWKDVKGFKGLYKVSDFGRVWSLTKKRNSRHGTILYKGRFLSPGKSKKGYLKVCLHKNKTQTSAYVHVLVANHFVTGKKKGLEVNHKDANKSNNHYSNLEWATHQYNLIHAHGKGLIRKGSGVTLSKLVECQVGKIKKSLKEGAPIRELAKEFNISHSVISQIAKNKAWTHVS